MSQQQSQQGGQQTRARRWPNRFSRLLFWGVVAGLAACSIGWTIVVIALRRREIQRTTTRQAAAVPPRKSLEQPQAVDGLLLNSEQLADDASASLGGAEVEQMPSPDVGDVDEPPR